MNFLTSFSPIVKAYIQSNGTDLESLQQFKDTMELLTKCCYFQEIKQNQDFSLSWIEHITIDSMLSNDCNLGALLTLASQAMLQAIDHNFQQMNETQIAKDRGLANWYHSLGEQLTETCHDAANHTATGLPPQQFQVDPNSTSSNRTFNQLTGPYWLSPYLAESYFTLYRTTRDPKYREYAWELVQAIKRHAKAKHGYSAVKDVTRVPSVKLDYQPPYFIGSTLKYLFLIFVNPDQPNAVPIGKWVFTSAGQPLPIYGQHEAMYPNRAKQAISDFWLHLKRRGNLILEMTAHYREAFVILF